MQYVLAASFIFLACLISGWDVAMLYRDEPNSTVSTVLRNWSISWPILPFMVGVLVGHVFWGIS